MNRIQALKKPMSVDWNPKVGEDVWVPRISGTISVLISTGKIRVLAPPYARVFLAVGRQSRSMVFKIDDLRPVGEYYARI